MAFGDELRAFVASLVADPSPEFEAGRAAGKGLTLEEAAELVRAADT